MNLTGSCQTRRMNDPQRILSVFGTRPEAIKLFPLVHALAADARFVSRVCVSGQHRGLIDPVLQIAGITPDHDLDVMRPDQSLDHLTAVLLGEVGRVMDEERPDKVIVQGDTATAMAAAIAAFYRRVPVVHVEAGLRSGDIRHPWPEEGNRRIIGSLSAVHCAPTEGAARALLRENIDPATVHVTGNTVIDALHWVTGRITREPHLVAGMAALERRFDGRRIIAVTCHRRESFGAGVRGIAAALRHLAARPDVALIFPLHPNPQVRAVMEAELAGVENLVLIGPLDYPAFARLMDISHFMLTDSGGVQEEAPTLGTPVLVMRDTTERPEGVEAGTARLVGNDPARIIAEAERLLDEDGAHAAMARAHNPFGDGRAAPRIVELLAAGQSG